MNEALPLQKSQKYRFSRTNLARCPSTKRRLRIRQACCNFSQLDYDDRYKSYEIIPMPKNNPRKFEETAWILFKNEDLERFKEEMMEVNWAQISHDISFPWKEIETAASHEDQYNEFITAMIKAGFDLNRDRDKFGNGFAHIAADRGNLSLLQLLVDHEADVNLKNWHGDTVLLRTLKACLERCKGVCSGHLSCFRFLLQLPDTDSNISDDDDFTPMKFALKPKSRQFSGCQEYINLLMEVQTKSVNWEVLRMEEENARQSWIKNELEMTGRISNRSISNRSISNSISENTLFLHLKQGMDDKFCEALQSIWNDKGVTQRTLSTISDGRFTYLQYACKYGLAKSALLLISYGVDINHSRLESERPIVLACKAGSLKILQHLVLQENVDLSTDEYCRSLLHIIARSPEKSKRHFKCLRLLLCWTSLNIQEPDDSGKTPLHYAVIYRNEKCILELLDKGAHIDTKDYFGQKLLKHVPFSTLKKHLDSKISTNSKNPRLKDYALIFDYKNFLQQGKGNKKDDMTYSFPTSLLSYLIELPALSEAIAHPMLSTLIYFKWVRIRWFYYISLAFYAIFCSLFTAYTLLADTNANSTQICSNVSSSKADNYPQKFTSLRIIENVLFGMICILSVRELIEMSGGCFKYHVKTFENIIMIIIIILSTTVIFNDCSSQPKSCFCPQLSAFSILLVWFELFFLIGKLPKLMFYVTLFRVASAVLLNFLMIHIFLIIGFALCFHELFRGDEANPFSNPSKAIFKTIVMITSEFDAEGIPFDTHIGAKHILFVAFIFIVTIVLFNLMIGLAYSSAVKQIEGSPFLYKCKAQVEIISYIESTYFVNKNKVVKKCASLLTFCRKIFNYKEEDRKQMQVFIYPNQGNKIQNFFIFNLYNSSGYVNRTLNSVKGSRDIDREIVRTAQQIVEKKIIARRENQAKAVDFTDRLSTLEEEIKDIKKIILGWSKSQKAEKVRKSEFRRS